MGEAVLRDIAEKRGVDIIVDSCGTGGYHVGESPDERYVLLDITFFEVIEYDYYQITIGQ